jgi:hypothetical protein
MYKQQQVVQKLQTYKMKYTLKLTVIDEGTDASDNVANVSLEIIKEGRVCMAVFPTLILWSNEKKFAQEADCFLIKAHPIMCSQRPFCVDNSLSLCRLSVCPTSGVPVTKK